MRLRRCRRGDEFRAKLVAVYSRLTFPISNDSWLYFLDVSGKADVATTQLPGRPPSWSTALQGRNDPR